MSEMLASLQLKFSPTVRRDILVEKDLFTMCLPELTSKTQLVRADKPLKIVFPFIAQIHQSLHSLPIAAAMAKLYPDVEVHLAGASQPQLNLIRHLATYYPEAPLNFSRLNAPAWVKRRLDRQGPSPLDKILTLFHNRGWLDSFDAIVVPERTCLYLRHMGVHHPKLIYTGHGAGDRAIGFASDIKHYDYVLVPGRKVEERLLQAGAISPQRYFRGVYAKFDLMRRMGTRELKLFNNDRPTVVYNPHFSRALSSWRRFGRDVLEYFANQTHFNLIFAPHYRLFDRHREEGQKLIEQYRAHAHMLIDPGSMRSVDMTYTLAADIYLGDVSSQVAEFITRPRPCIFLNAHDAKWHNNPNYRSWTLGDVIGSPAELAMVLLRNVRHPDTYRDEQMRYMQETFDHDEADSTSDAAQAIIEYLSRSA